MLNKIFYFVRIITILSLNFIGPYCCAYARIVEVPYGSMKRLIIIPGYTYTVKVLGVGIKTSDGIQWDEWKHKNDCCIKAEYDDKQNKQVLYQEQVSYSAIYEDKTKQKIVFKFLKTDPNRQPKGVFCQIEIIALDGSGQPIPDAVMGSLTQMTMHENTILNSKEQNQEQKNAALLSTNTPSIEESNDPLIGYGTNEEADHGCCGRKKRPYGM